MSWIRSIVREVVGLFVDDGSFAMAVIVWLALAGFVLPRLRLRGHAAGVILFVGLGLILLESVLRFSKRKAK